MINPKKELAENIDLSTYETTPIESYGLKMLQKMSSNNNTNINRKRKELFYNLSNIIRCDHRKNRDGAIVRYKGNTYYVNVNKKYFKLIHNN